MTLVITCVISIAFSICPSGRCVDVGWPLLDGFREETPPSVNYSNLRREIPTENFLEDHMHLVAVTVWIRDGSHSTDSWFRLSRKGSLDRRAWEGAQPPTDRQPLVSAPTR